jgi:hypothetical protein
MKLPALCPISGSKVSRERHEMRLISKLGFVYLYGSIEGFPIFNSICLCLSKADTDRQGRNFGITTGRGGGGMSLFFPNEKGGLKSLLTDISVAN